MVYEETVNRRERVTCTAQKAPRQQRVDAAIPRPQGSGQTLSLGKRTNEVKSGFKTAP